MSSNETRVGRAVAGLVAAALVAVGCTGETAGSPTTADPTSTTPGTTSPSSLTTTETESPFVERPREIPLDDLNPCEVWTADQLRELEVGPEPSPGDPQPNPLGEMSCSYHGPIEPVEIGYSAVLGIGDVTDRLDGHQSRTTATVAEVARFPAVRAAQPEGSIDPCDFYIGTAEGEHLWIALSTVFPNELSVEETCAMALTAAEMAMETLQTLR